jgi:hypothetical protein
MDQDEARKARQANAMEAFWKAAREGASRLMDEATEWRGPEARYYRNEGTIFMEHVTHFYWGLAAGSFLFITFRVTGSKRFQLFREKYFYKKPMHATMSNAADPSKQQWKSLLERQMEEKAELANDLTRLPFDIFVSIMGGCSSVLLLSKPDKLERDFVAAPLVPGKSLIHKAMCPPFEAAFDKQDPTVFREKDAGMLVTFEHFVRNCRIRSEFIQQQTQRGDARPNVVPYPGLQGVSR